MRKNYFLSAALIALTGFGLVGCSDNPDRITNVNEVVAELTDFGGYIYHDANNNGSVDSGEALAGAIVQVVDPVSDKTFTATADSNGRFDFTNSFTQGTYNVKITDAAGTVSGAIVNSVEYYFPETVVNLTSASDGADGTPERNAVSANFSMVDEPVIVASNLSSYVPGAAFDISGLTELTFTFNKPVTVIGDPSLVDTTAQPNKKISFTAEGTSAASIKGAVVTTSRTTVAYALPTLDSKHTFTLTWPNTSYKATDSGAFGLIAAPTGNSVQGASAAAAATLAVPAAAYTMNTNLAAVGGIAVNTGSAGEIVTTAKTATIVSVTDAAAATNSGWNNLNSKYTIFAPKACLTTNSQTGAVASSTYQTGGRVDTNSPANDAIGTLAAGMTRTYKIQLSNIQNDLDYIPVVSYDGGTTWYFAGTTYVQGSTAQNGALTLTTGNIDGLATTLPRPYYLVKGYYNTSTTDGENFTRLRVAMRRTDGTNLAVTIGSQVGAVANDQPTGYTANGIDTNTERKTDTWVNLFDGDLTDYKNRGFARTANVLTGSGDQRNGIPAPEDNVNRAGANQYRNSSYPFPLYVDGSVSAIETTIGARANWFNLVEDGTILTDLVEHDGDLRNTTILAGQGSPVATWGLQAGDIVISGMEEAASATVNANDVPNPSLGSKNTVVYVYFNEPMDSATIQTTTNWKVVSTGASTAPSVSSVVYTELINTANGAEAFRAKVTMSGAMPDDTQLELSSGALIDKNGNYPVCQDGNKPTGYITVFHTNN